MSGGVPAWTDALNRSVLAAPLGSSSKVRLIPFSLATAWNRWFIRPVTSGKKSNGCHTTTGPPAAGLAASAGFEAAAGAEVAAAPAAGAAGLVSAGFDSAGLAGALVAAGAAAGEPQAARTETPAAPARTPRKPRREKIRSDAMDLSLPQWSVRG